MIKLAKKLVNNRNNRNKIIVVYYIKQIAKNKAQIKLKNK